MAAGRFVKYVATSNRKRCWNEQATIYLTAVDEVRGGATTVAVFRDFSVAPVSINTLNTSVVTKYVSLSSKERICSTCLNLVGVDLAVRLDLLCLRSDGNFLFGGEAMTCVDAAGLVDANEGVRLQVLFDTLEEHILIGRWISAVCRGEHLKRMTH